jgi:hypothetical protein
MAKKKNKNRHKAAQRAAAKAKSRDASAETTDTDDESADELSESSRDDARTSDGGESAESGTRESEAGESSGSRTASPSKAKSRSADRGNASKGRSDEADDASESGATGASRSGTESTSSRDESSDSGTTGSAKASKSGSDSKSRSQADTKASESRLKSRAERKAEARAAEAEKAAGAPSRSKWRKGKQQLPTARATKGAAGKLATRGGFWFGFEITWAKLALARVVVFGLLAIDALLQIRHAPRYGAGGFNVGQVFLFDDLGPGRVAYGACQLVIAYLLVLAMFNIAMRAVLPIAAALYAWLYFGSQLDSYQHHYLVVLLLVIASFVPWKRPPDAEPSTPVRSWALRLLLVQLAIMYLWAAVSKLDPAWLDGRTLGSQVSGAMRGAITSTVGFKVVAVGVIGVELVLAATVWWRRAWFIAAPLGILFHGGILLSELEIGIFAFLMVALYIFIVPDRIWVWLAEQAPVLAIRDWLKRVAERTSWTSFVVALVLGLGFALLVRIPNALPVAAVICLVPVAIVNRSLVSKHPPTWTLAIAHVAAIMLWLAVDRVSAVASDYYTFWGGSQRRLGHLETAERVYRTQIDVMPSDPAGHFHLGRLLLANGRDKEGLDELHDAQRLDSSHAKAWIAESRWLLSRGNKLEATAKAKEAVFAEPDSQDARTLLDSLSGKKSAAKPGSDDDDTDTQ